jgi:ABC-type antimicrobial peptide transport system permease subunit
MAFRIEGEEVAAEGALKSAFFTAVSPNYFAAMGIPLKMGRLLTKDDRADSPAVVVLNEAASNRYFPKGGALGKRLRFGKGEGGIVAEVVGVVASTKNRGLDRPEGQELFVSLPQVGFSNQMMTVVRASGDPLALTATVRETVKQLDPLQPIYQVQTIEQAYAAVGIQRRIATWALLVFASFALLLASAGVYSVASYAAAARTREIGVRMAIGATEGDVRRLVARQALIPVTIGATLGLVAAAFAGNGMGGMLFQVRGYDPLTLGLSLVVLAAMALIAADGPARKAGRTNLVAALTVD